MTRLRYNGLSTALGVSLGSGATAITFAAALTHSGGTSVPTITGTDYIPLSILDTNGVMKEVVYLTAYTAGATTGTVTRGQEGTVGTNVHANAALVRHSPFVLDVTPGGGFTPVGGATGHVLTKTSSADFASGWVAPTSGGATTLDGLTDADTSTTPPSAAFQGLVWDGTSQWKPSTVPVVRRNALVNPSVVQMYEGGGSATASWTPTGLANGDVLIYAICSQSPVSAPAGMTSIYSDSAWASFWGGYNIIATKAVGTAENTVTVTVSGLNTDTRWAVYYIRGLSQVPVAGDAVASARGASSAPYVWPGITATKSTPKLQVLAGTSVGNTATKIDPPPEMLSRSGGHGGGTGYAYQSAGFATRTTTSTSTSFTSATASIPNRIDSVMVTITLTATVATSSLAPVNALGDISDVSVGVPTDKQVLGYDAANGVWTPQTAATGGTSEPNHFLLMGA
jgi:hypothetical protein